jgi:hypothetical protein
MKWPAFIETPIRAAKPAQSPPSLSVIIKIPLFSLDLGKQGGFVLRRAERLLLDHGLVATHEFSRAAFFHEHDGATRFTFVNLTFFRSHRVLLVECWSWS